MNMVWNWWAVPGTFVFIAAWASAIIVIRTAPQRPLNRHLSIVLILEGLFGACAIGLLFFFESRQLVQVFATCGAAILVALPFQYISFLAVSFKTPLVAPFQSRAAIILLAMASIIGGTLVLTNPQIFISELYSPDFAPWNFRYEKFGLWAVQLQGYIALYGLLIAISAYIYAKPGSAARNRAKWFAIAFGVRDVYVGITQIMYPVIRPIPYWGEFILNPGTALVYIIYVLLLAYAVLKIQLFDIDLKVKFVLHKSTLVALIGLIYIVSSELLETLIPVQDTVLRVIVALVLLLLLRPIHQIAVKITGNLMQGVDGTESYLEVRKIEVYRAAVEVAIEDGVITKRERSILTLLRDKLELSEDEGNAIEQSFIVNMTRDVRSE